MRNFHVKPVFTLRQPVSFSMPFKNLTLPVLVPSLKRLGPITEFAKVDYGFVIGVTCVCAAGVMIIVLLVGLLVYRKCCVIDVGELYTNTGA